MENSVAAAEKYDTQKMEVIFNASKRFSLAEAISKCLGFEIEDSECCFYSNIDFEDEIQLEKLPAAEKDGDSSGIPEVIHILMRNGDERNVLIVVQRVPKAVPAPKVPTPAGGKGSSGRRN